MISAHEWTPGWCHPTFYLSSGECCLLGVNGLLFCHLGHWLQETVMVSVCLCSEGYSPVTMGSGSVTYVDNMACRLARLLVTQADRLTACSHQMLLTPFALTTEALPALDEELVLALSQLELPLGWTVLGNFSLEGRSVSENSGVRCVLSISSPGCALKFTFSFLGRFFLPPFSWTFSPNVAWFSEVSSIHLSAGCCFWAPGSLRTQHSRALRQVLVVVVFLYGWFLSLWLWTLNSFGQFVAMRRKRCCHHPNRKEGQ